MAMQLGGSGGVKSDINVTPLVDVMLVLLIIMMIVAPLLQQVVPVTLPLAQHSIEKEDSPEQTVVTVDALGRFFVGAQEVAKADLRQSVMAVLDTKRERLIMFKADEEAEYGAVMAAMDELRAAGIEDIALITERTAPAGAGLE